MFQNATLKLTGWYLLILMTISIIFSLAIYNIASNEVNDRLGQLQARLEQGPAVLPLPPQFNYETFRAAQFEVANRNLASQLVYANFFILLFGGFGAYFLARRTLKPIEQAHEAQARFVSDASHELKTPLAAMKAELEVALKDKNLKVREARDLLESNLEEVDKLTALSGTLLQLSELDHAHIEKEMVSLNEITKYIVKKYDKTGKRIALTLSSKNQRVYANRPSIEELVTILVDNALKYSPPDSLVTIKTSRRARHALFEITNTGKGIAAEDLPHIFDRFYRADTARTRNKTKNGHGLGLSLAKRIVELHNGQLLATSAPDHATTFTFLLPLGKSQANLKQ